jgi:hypothetical protein
MQMQNHQTFRNQSRYNSSHPVLADPSADPALLPQTFGKSAGSWYLLTRRLLAQPAGDAAGRAADAGQDHEARRPALRRDAPLRLRLLEGQRPPPTILLCGCFPRQVFC